MAECDIDTILALETEMGTAFGQIEDGLFRVNALGGKTYDPPVTLSYIVGGLGVERMLVDALIGRQKDAEQRRRILDLLGTEHED